MGKTDRDQHQIDKNPYCSVTFSKIRVEIGLLVLQNPYMTEENENFGKMFNSSKLIHIG